MTPSEMFGMIEESEYEYVHKYIERLIPKAKALVPVNPRSFMDLEEVVLVDLYRVRILLIFGLLRL